MKLSTLALYIGLAILGFWLLGLLFDLVKWMVDIALIMGLVLVIISLLGQYAAGKKQSK